MSSRARRLRGASASMLAVAALLLCTLAPRAAFAAPPNPPQPAPSSESAAAAPAPAPAPSASPAADDDRETVVTGDRPREGRGAETIDRTSLAEQGATTAIEALERTPAVHATGGVRGERMFSIRGLDARQTPVLLDGLPFVVPYDGQVDLTVFAAGALQQLTVYKGALAPLDEPSALGGAVDLVLRRPGHGPLCEVLFEGGDLVPGRLAASHAYRTGPLAWSAFGGYLKRRGFPLAADFTPTAREDGGVRTNSDRRSSHAGGVVSARLNAQHELRASALWLDDPHGIPPETVGDVPRYWRFTRWNALATTLGHTGHYGPRWHIEERLYLRRFENLLDSYDDITYSSQDKPRAFHSLYTDWIVGGRTQVLYLDEATSLGALAFRTTVDARHERHSDRFDHGEPVETRTRTVVQLAPQVDVRPGAAWRLTLGLDAALDLPGTAPGTTPPLAYALSPLAVLRFEPDDTLMVRVQAARRTRFASLKERFSAARGARRENPTLAPESALHLGLDAAWQPLSWLRLEAALFDAEVVDLIEPVALGGGVEQLQNVGRARFLGGEVSFRAAFERYVGVSVGYAGLHAKRLGADAPLTGRPAHRATFAIDSRPLRWLELWAFARLIGPQDSRDPDGRERTHRLSTNFTLDARVVFRPLEALAIHWRATNLLDVDTQSEYGFPDPGRELWVGLEWTFGAPEGDPARAP